MYRTVDTICTAQWSLYVPHSGHYMYRTVVTICTAQRTLYVPHSGHYMYRKAVTICTAQRSLYVPHRGHYVPHRGHYIYRTVVTICTAQCSIYVPHSGRYMYRQFNIQQFYVLPTQFVCFVCISEQTAIISLYNINWLVFITETECVYCEVRTGHLYIVQASLSVERCYVCVLSRPVHHCSKLHFDRHFS